MNDTELDERLRADGARWREHRPAGPYLTLPASRVEFERVLDEPAASAADVIEVGGPDDPHDASTARRRPSRRRVLPLIAASAVIVASATAFGVISATRHDRAKLNGPSGKVTSDRLVGPPAGFQQVSYHGISVNVPQSWQVRPVYCGAPAANAVSPFDGQAASCPSQPRTTSASTTPRYTLVNLVPSSQYTPEHPVTSTSVRVDGLAARRDVGSGTEADLVVLRIPALDVAVAVTAPTSAAALAVVRTVQVTPVDARGCVDRLASVVPTGNADAKVLIPGRPAAGVVCEYLSPGLGGTAGVSWLVGSRALSGADLSRVRSLLNAYVPSSATFAPFEFPVSRYLLRYPNGQTRTVATTINDTPQIASDGHRTVESKPTNRYVAVPGAFAD